MPGAKSAKEMGMKKLILTALALALSACATVVPRTDPGSPASWAPVDPQRLSDWTRQLASDDFQGRAPGTEGETRTVAWLTEQFRAPIRGRPPPGPRSIRSASPT